MNYTLTFIFILINITLTNINYGKPCEKCCKNGSCRCEKIEYEEDKNYLGRENLINDEENTEEYYKEEEIKLVEYFNSLIEKIIGGNNNNGKTEGKNELIKNITDTMSDHNVGIPDIGNTCYINVIIQMISHSKKFVSVIISKAIDIYNKKEDIKTYPMISSLSICLLELYYAQKSINDANSNTVGVKKAIRTLIYFYLFNQTKCKTKDNNRYKIFKIPNQGDPSEFLDLLLCDIEKEGENITNSLKIQEKNICEKCNGEIDENIEETKIFITRHVPELKNVTETNNTKCNCSKKDNISTTHKIIKNANDVIIIQINQIETYTTTEDKYMRKNKNEIILNEEITINNKKYILKSYTDHYGSTQGGHYANYTKTNKSWIQIEDSTVTEIETNLKSQHTYMVLYEKNES